MGDILKRLQQQSISNADVIPDWVEELENTNDLVTCTFCGGRGWVRADLPVNDPKFGTAIPCTCKRIDQGDIRLPRLQKFSNLGVLGTVDFDDVSRTGPSEIAESQARYLAAYDAALEFCNNPLTTMVFVGGNGTGKTYLAAAVANSLINNGHPVFFSFVPDLLDQLRGSFTSDADFNYDEMFEQVKNVQVLILDDLGIQSSTPWAEEKLFQIINHRFLSSLPTLITSSVPLERMDGRLQSRLSDPRTSRVIDLGGSSRTRSNTMGLIEPTMLKNMTFGSFDIEGKAYDRQGRETLNAARAISLAFSANPEGWLVLVGDSGCGKTHLAVSIANDRMAKGDEVFFAFVPDLLDHLRYTFSPDSRVTYDELFDRIKQASLLMLDDLGSESSTTWANEKLYQIIVHRHNAQLPTVITTRAIPSAAKDPVASRLNDARLVQIMPITAPDYRDVGR